MLLGIPMPTRSIQLSDRTASIARARARVRQPRVRVHYVVMSTRRVIYGIFQSFVRAGPDDVLTHACTLPLGVFYDKFGKHRRPGEYKNTRSVSQISAARRRSGT